MPELKRPVGRPREYATPEEYKKHRAELMKTYRALRKKRCICIICSAKLPKSPNYNKCSRCLAKARESNAKWAASRKSGLNA